MKILLIDNYDSFTFNLYHYISSLNTKVDVVRNDKINSKEIIKKKYDKIVISPGPGNPNQSGNCIKILKSLYKELPFLGVHFTQTMKGFVEAGPNAVLATKREGYRKRDFSFKDSFETFTYKGFWKLLKKDWQTGLWEINRSLRKSVFLKSLRLLIPEIEKNHI